jgi:chromosome segregation ATPase
MFISKKKYNAFVESMRGLQNKFTTNKLKTENNMKKILLTGLIAFAAVLGKKTEEEIEFSQDDAQKTNDELELRAQTIDTLTTERDELKTSMATLTTDKATVDTALATAKTRITELEASNATLTTENIELKANPGAKPAASATAGDPEAGEKKVKLAANSDDFMTNLENVKKAYV